ncbi:MAG: hypothetical protein KDD61_07505, partial [Bdellovibrionales bacterium]|nr:hypothetical protein [Bdellovibrionales bacterium]
KSTAESFLYRDIFIYFLRENLGKWVQGLWRSEGLSESEFTKWILKTTENPFARSGDKVRKELSADSSFYLFPSWEIFDDPKEFSMVAPSDPKSEVGPQFPGSRALQSHFLWMQEIANIDDGLNFGAHQLLYKTREVLWTLSNEMVKAHHIGSSQDLFYLTVTDLRNYLTLPRNLKELVRRRKRIWQMNVNQPEPWEFPHHGKEKSAAINQNSLTDKKVLQGQGNAMGRIEGLVYQLQNLDFIEDIPVGAIVVTKVPHPILLRKFANIKGIVSETGSRLSHGIVLASEYNIPVVSSLPGIVEHLQTGDSVMLDSYSGEVSFSETL